MDLLRTRCGLLGLLVDLRQLGLNGAHDLVGGGVPLLFALLPGGSVRG
ncbi:hypothetical protein [Micromonospora sp. NPDC049497]